MCIELTRRCQWTGSTRTVDPDCRLSAIRRYTPGTREPDPSHWSCPARSHGRRSRSCLARLVEPTSTRNDRSSSAYTAYSVNWFSSVGLTINRSWVRLPVWSLSSGYIQWLLSPKHEIKIERNFPPHFRAQVSPTSGLTYYTPRFPFGLLSLSSKK